MELKRHPWDHIHQDYEVSCDIKRLEGHLRVDFHIKGYVQELILEPVAEYPVFRDEIWQSCCFELFVQAPNKTDYSEFNFAPNGDWAAYHFDDYRKGMKKLSIKQPNIQLVKSNENLDVIITLDNLTNNMENSAIGLCVILESPEGKSYWALKHCADKPDFHQKYCFLWQLEAR